MVKIVRNDAKASNASYDLWHPTAMTKDTDFLVVCGVKDDAHKDDADASPIAIPIHKELAARSATFFDKFLKHGGKPDCGEIVIDTFRPKTMLNYFRSIYDENIKISPRNSVELYCLAKFLKDVKLEGVVRDNIKGFIGRSLLTAFDCFGLLFMTDAFDNTVIDHIKKQKTLRFAKGSFLVPQDAKEARRAIKRNLMKAHEPIAKLAVDKMVRLVGEIGAHVEVECLYYLIKMWLRGENNYANLDRVLEKISDLKSGIRPKWKLYRHVVEWVRHHSPDKGDELSVKAFNVIFRHEEGIDTVEDLDKALPVDESSSSPDVTARLATPVRAKRLVRKLSRTLSQISLAQPKNSTMNEPVRNEIGQIRRFEDIISGKAVAAPTAPDASSIISDDPFGDSAPVVPETRGPSNAVAARAQDTSGASAAAAPSGEFWQIRFSVQRAGGLIGQGGANIKELKSCSDAMVELDGPRNSRELIAKLKDPGQKNKIQKLFSIEGDKTECLKVIDKMIEFLDYNGSVRLSLLSEGHLTGCLIGKGGSVIRAMKEESECRIDIDKEPYEGSSEKQVRLFGESERIRPLIEKILVLLQKAKARPPRDGTPESNPWFPTVPVEWLEGYESEKDSDDESGSDSDDSDAGEKSSSIKRTASGGDDGPAEKRAKSDDDDGDGFF